MHTYTHRSILFKYLCDQVNAARPSGAARLDCRLVRGGKYKPSGHVWNVVRAVSSSPSQQPGDWFVIDVMISPSELYPQGSHKAKKYMRRAGPKHAEGAGLISTDPASAKRYVHPVWVVYLRTRMYIHKYIFGQEH